MKRMVYTPDAPKPLGPYSQANIATGRAVYLAGQVPIDPASGKPVEGGIEAQTTRVFKNIAAILAASGAALKDVVKVNVYLSNMADFGKMNEIYARYFPIDCPARTTIQAVLPGGFLLEVDAVAYVE